MGCKSTVLAHVELFYISALKLFYAGLFSISSLLSLYLFSGLSWLRWKTLHLAFLNFPRSTWPHFLSLSMPSEWYPSNIPPGCQLHHTAWCCQKIAEGLVDPSVHVTHKDVKQCSSQYWPPKNTDCYQSLLDVELLTATLWVKPSKGPIYQFKPPDFIWAQELLNVRKFLILFLGGSHFSHATF